VTTEGDRFGSGGGAGGGPSRGGLEAQLDSLYEDRARLHRELGTADPDEIVAMIRNLEDQLLELYRERAEAFAEERRSVAVEAESRRREADDLRPRARAERSVSGERPDTTIPVDAPSSPRSLARIVDGDEEDPDPSGWRRS
jgi:hypothetical protein